MTATLSSRPYLVFETTACDPERLNQQNFFRHFALGIARWLMILSISLASGSMYAQAYEKLNELRGYNTVTYFSSGADVKAERMAKQLDRVMSFYHQLLGFTPSVTLLILSPGDWPNYTKFPFYGMPHYTNNKTLVVASENNDYWKSMQPPLDKIPADHAKMFTQTYLNQKNGQLTMEPFFDLLAIHELGHAYHNQGGLVMQRKWMAELFCNILLHGYIAEMEPELLNALKAFPEMVVATTNKTSLKYTTLEELETYYNDIGPNHPQNYGWYQCRWHVAAGQIYDSAKIQGIKNLWMALKSQRAILTDSELTDFLSAKVHQSVADIPTKWNEN